MNASNEETAILSRFTFKVGGRERITQMSTCYVDVIRVKLVHAHIAPFRYAIINLQNTSIW